MKIKSVIFLLIFGLCNLYAFSQFSFSKKIDIEDENLTLKGTVLLKDNDGFIWIGTSDGLFKYNAVTPEKIILPVKDKIYITSLYEDEAGTIWAGCKTGQIFTIKNHYAALFKIEEGLPKTAITAICEDEEQRMWFATAGEGIYCYNKIHLYNINAADGLSDNNVNCLYNPGNKLIVAGTDRGISFIEFEKGKKTVHFFSSKNGLPDNIVTCIAKSTEKNFVWVAMQSKGILLFDIVNKKIIKAFTGKGWSYGQVNKILDQGEEIFIATEENGILSYNKFTDAVKSKILKDSIFTKRITALQEDNEGNIWATAENKLISFTSNYLKYWYTTPTASLVKIHTLLAEDEKFWFTPDQGLYEYVADKLSTSFTHRYFLTKPEELIDITSLYRDDLGFLWVGTMGAGLFRLNTVTGKWRRLDENPIVLYGNILSIAGRGNEVWVSTLNGVGRFILTETNRNLSEKINYQNYNKNNGLGSDYVYQILVDKKNRVWFATDGAGVAVFENGRFTNFYLNKKFPSKVTYSLAEDKNGHIWINSFNDGLFEYNEKKFKQYGIEIGLSDLAITSIAVDDYNNIIAVSKKGIDLIGLDRNTVQHFGAECGFSEQQPNLNSISKDKKGNIWIGTENGIACFRTSKTFFLFKPKAVIENVLLFNAPININSQNRFNYNENNLSFKFAVAYYKAPEKIRLQYWLDGYSKNWETTKDNLINFPQLNTGSYTMKVRASANNNFSLSHVAIYKFTIVKAFWNTWWFRFFLLSAISILGYIFFMRRIAAVRKKEKTERERFQLQYDALKNQVNPHFLFNSFNALLNIIEDNPKEAGYMIKHLSQFYRKMTAYSDKELITLAEEVELLKSYLHIQQKRFGSALQINMHFEPSLLQTTFIPPLVLQLLTENALKHNKIIKSNPLIINIFTADDLIIIKNNINLKLEKEEGEGLGLQNIENRYRLLTNRKMIIRQTETEYIVSLPIIHVK